MPTVCILYAYYAVCSTQVRQRERNGVAFCFSRDFNPATPVERHSFPCSWPSGGSRASVCERLPKCPPGSLIGRTTPPRSLHDRGPRHDFSIFQMCGRRLEDPPIFSPHPPSRRSQNPNRPTTLVGKITSSRNINY